MPIAQHQLYELAELDLSFQNSPEPPRTQIFLFFPSCTVLYCGVHKPSTPCKSTCPPSYHFLWQDSRRQDHAAHGVYALTGLHESSSLSWNSKSLLPGLSDYRQAQTWVSQLTAMSEDYLGLSIHYWAFCLKRCYRHSSCYARVCSLPQWDKHINRTTHLAVTQPQQGW